MESLRLVLPNTKIGKYPQEAQQCHQIAQKALGALEFPLHELPALLIVSPVQLRNSFAEQEINPTQAQARAADQVFIDSVKLNVEKNKNAEQSDHPTTCPESSEGHTEAAVTDNSALQRLELKSRIFLLLELYSRDQEVATRKDRLWSSRKRFGKELLKWARPLILYLDVPETISPIQNFSDFLQDLHRFYSSSSALCQVLQYLADEFELDELDLSFKPMSKPVEPVQDTTILKKRKRVAEKAPAPTPSSRRTLTANQLRSLSGNFYHSSSLMRQVTVKRNQTNSGRQRRVRQLDTTVESDASRPPAAKRHRAF